jgi:hypothetical protein
MGRDIVVVLDVVVVDVVVVPPFNFDKETFLIYKEIFSKMLK